MAALEILENNTKNPTGKHPILFIHGMWHGAWVWESRFLPYFEKIGYKAYAVSLSNHANSARKKAFNLLRINDYVNDIEQTVNSFDSKPVLVGHSMGGYIVQKYLEKNTVPGAVLMASVPPFGIWRPTLDVLKKFPLDFIVANITLNLKHVVNSTKRYNHILGSENVTIAEVKSYLEKINTESYLAYLDMLGVNLVKPYRINTPLLILGGEKDRAIPLKALNLTAKKFGVNPIIFNRMGHNMMLEPGYKKVADKIDQWVKNLEALG